MIGSIGMYKIDEIFMTQLKIDRSDDFVNEVTAWGNYR